ncbi:MAG TPA: serine hydrolase domain-containing protein [Acetobacteraceae bacterium]
MLRRGFMTQAAATAGAATLTAPAATAAAAKAEDAQRSVGASLDAALRPYLSRFNLPALAAAVARRGSVAASGAVGTRRMGTDIPVSIDDRFHIGSDTKAMTALLGAMLIEAGKLRWDSKVAESFPELAGTMTPELRGVTLERLLSHTSGLPSDNQAFIDVINRSFAQDGLNLDELRYWVIRESSTQPLASQPGAQFAYSNLGYTLAGAIIERAGGKTWEELVSERVFDALGLRSAGIGPQASVGRVDAPLGHAVRDDGTLKPMLAGPNGDAPAVVGPAGTVHLSVLDFAAWAGWNAGEGRRGPALVRPETIRKLHTQVIVMPPRPDATPGTPVGIGYALGWGLAKLPYVSEPVLMHAGSNTMNFASILVQPSQDFAVVMMTNVGGAKAEAAIGQLTEELYRQYGPSSG